MADHNIHPNKRFSASSSRLGGEPYEGRLWNNMGAWSPSNNNNADDYLEINLADDFFICAVATQGNPKSDEWTKTYKLHLFLEDWIIYKENNTEKVCKKCKISPLIGIMFRFMSKTSNMQVKWW